MRAFEGDDVSETLAFILTREPKWAALPTNTPTRIRRLLRRCLERDRKHRVADISTAVFVIDEVYAANGQLYVRSIAEVEARAIQGTGQGAEEPFFSPDGKWVAFYVSAERKIKKVAVTGGASVTVCDADPLFGASWAPDDTIFFGQGRGGVLRVSANGSKPDVVFKSTQNEFAHGPQVLPGGDALLFTLAQRRNSQGWDMGKIVVQSLKSGERHVLIEGGSDARYVPTGHIVYAVGRTVLAVPFGSEALQITGNPAPVIEDVRRAPLGTTGAAQFSISNNGSIAYVPAGLSGGEVTLTLIDRAGTRTPLNIESGAYNQPRISPNGEQLAVEKDDGKEQNVWIYGLKDAVPLRRLTFGGAINITLNWFEELKAKVPTKSR